MEQPTLADRIRFVLFERGYQEARTVAQLASATGLIEEDIRVHLVGVKSMILSAIPGVSVGFDHLDRLCAWRSEPRPGFKVIEYFAGGSDAHEVYDIDEHIRRALRRRTDVTYQNTLSLDAYGVDEKIPASDGHHEPAIRARLKEAIETGRKIEGVVADYDSEGRLIAYPLLEVKSDTKQDALAQAILDCDAPKAMRILREMDADKAPKDGHSYQCCGKVGRISPHKSWCEVNKQG